jgi:transcriptional regulator with XRE-family HTH domain
MNVSIIPLNGGCAGQTIVRRAPVTRRPDRVRSCLQYRLSQVNKVESTLRYLLELIAWYNQAMHKRREMSAILVDQGVGSRVRMRRLMLKLSQTDLADGLGLTFQQVQKYEKGMNRIGAGRLQQIAHILQVPVTFFFETASPHPPTVAQDQSLANLNDFMATRDGLTLAKAFMTIGDIRLRRRIVDLVEEIERSQH